MLQTANTTFPEYIQELEGIAYGSGVDFQTLFVLNVRNELKSFQGNNVGFKTQSEREHCSDYLMNDLNGSGSDGVSQIVVAHNEDGGWEDRDESWLITAHVEGPNVREAIRFTCKFYLIFNDISTANNVISVFFYYTLDAAIAFHFLCSFTICITYHFFFISLAPGFCPNFL